MAPPPNLPHAVHPVLREVTEDTPPDLLEGQMDLLVVLPTQKTVRMTVPRRQPMMDLLIQVTTANKINPGGHIVQVRNDVGIIMKYKPSTPIGALDTTTIEIVPKNQVNEYIIVKKQTAKIANQPFETTTRLQVHLPRNQLYVMRVGPKTLLADILQEVCQEKNLDYTKYELRHPVNLDEKLPLDQRMGEFNLSELTVVSRNSRINSSVSTADIMALQNEEGRSKMDSAFKHSRSSVGGDSSMSSESTASGNRGISPSRSDDSRSISPLPPVRPKLKLNSTMSNASSSSGVSSSAVPNKSQFTNQMLKSSTSSNNIMQAPPRPKKRAAPPPPTLVSSSSTPGKNNNADLNVTSSAPAPVNNSNCIRQTTSVVSSPTSASAANSSTIVSPPIRPTPRKKEPPREPPRNQTLPINHSRHSSDSSGYHECESVGHQENQMHRFDRQQSVPAIGNLSNLHLHSTNHRVSGSVSVSNLTTVSSISSTSLASSTGGHRKRKAPRPPNLQAPVLQAQKETDEEFSLSVSASTTGTTTSSSESSSLISQAAEPSSTPRRHNSESPIINSSSNNISKTSNNKLLDSRRRGETSSLEEVEVEVDVHQESSTDPAYSRVHQITVDLEQNQPVSSSSPSSTVQENSSTSSNKNDSSSDNKKDVLTSQKESNSNYNQNSRNNNSTDQPLSLETASLPPSSASSLSSSPGSSQGSTSSSPLPSTIEVETPHASAANAVVESSQVQETIPEKHSITTTTTTSTVVEGGVSGAGETSFPSSNNSSVKSPSPSPSSSSSSVLVETSMNNRSRPVGVSSPSPVAVEITSPPVASRPLSNAPVGVHDTQIQDVLLSSESEASYTDSGIPAEITTPSPIDMDMDRSEKDISSVNSSRRSSIHSMDPEQTENENALREILQSKIEKEQEIVDKAFEGIEVDAIDMGNQNSDPNEPSSRPSNFDFAQPASMMSLSKNTNPITTSATSSPHPVTEPSDDEERDGAFSSSNDEEKELKFSSGAEDQDSLRRGRSSTGISSENDKSLSSTTTTTTSSQSVSGKGGKSTNKKSPARKLSKSESFSHKSEFDAVKMKRKMFSKDGKSNAMRKSSYVSSSDDEELNGSKDQRKSSGNSIGSSGNTNGRAGSMQNLSQVDRNQKNSQQQHVNSRRNINNNNSSQIDNKSNTSTDNQGGFRKATSVMNIQDLDPNISQNPELMASFQSELESQFEQWKQQFLQKHLGGSKSESFDSTKDELDGEQVVKEESRSKEEISPALVVKTNEEIGGSNNKKSDAELNNSVDAKSSPGLKETVVNGTTTAQVHQGNLPKVVEAQEKKSTATKNKNIVNDQQQQTQQVVEKSPSSSSSSTLPSPIVHSEEKLTASHSQVLTKESESVQKSLVNEDSSSSPDSFDPERPQIIHSVATSTTAITQQQQQQQQSFDTPRQQEEEEIVEKFSSVETTTTSQEVVSQTDAHLVDSVKTEEISEFTKVDEKKHQTEAAVKEIMPVEAEKKELESEVEEVPLREKKPERVDEAPKIYRYTGPPSIQMGTWGERPARSVSVKRDNDYIMGMGQQDSSARPALGSVAKRIHSFAGVPVNQGVAPPPTFSRSSTLPDKNINGNQSSSAQVVPPPTRPKSFASANVYTMNAMSSQSFNSSSSSTFVNKNSVNSPTSGGVISGLKQRLQDQQVEKEKERQKQQQQSSQSSFELSEIALSPDYSSTPSPSSTSSSIEHTQNSVSGTNNNNNDSLERSKKLTPINHESSSNSNNNGNSPISLTNTSSNNNNNNSSNNNTQTVKISSYGESKKVSQLTNSFQSQSIDSTDSTSDYGSNSRPTSSLSRLPSNASTSNSNVTIGSMSDLNSTSSSPVPPATTSMWEKKRFFQGVNALEGGKEPPIPAQNLKGNIATIQKVFEQRQFLQQQQQKSATLTPSTSKESSPAPSVTLNNNSNSNNNNSISSTMMVQKVMRAGSFNVDAFRRTPSPSASLSSNTSSKSDERYNTTPSPIEGQSSQQQQQQQQTPVKFSISTNQTRNRFSVGNTTSGNSINNDQTSKKDDSSNVNGNIKHVGNKSIIIVGNDDSNSTTTSAVNNAPNSHNIFKQQLKVTSSSAAVPSNNSIHSNSIVVNSNNNNNNSNSTKINITGNFTNNSNKNMSNNNANNNNSNNNSSNNFKVQDKNIIKSRQRDETDSRDYSNVILKKVPASQDTSSSSSMTIHTTPGNKVSSIASHLTSNNSGFFSSLQRQPKPQQQSVVKPNSKSSDDSKPVIIEQMEKNRKTSEPSSKSLNSFNTNNNNNNATTTTTTTTANKTPLNKSGQSFETAPPPAPPMMISMDSVKLRPVTLGLASNGRSKSLSSTHQSNKVTSPTSPGDPRSEIFDAIKNSNGKFALRKTNSSMLLK